MDRACFACGPDNPNGLKLAIEPTAEGVTARVLPAAWTQGYHGIVHGGIICTLLDEIAVWAAHRIGHYAATGEINVRFKRSMEVGKAYRLNGRITAVKSILALAESEIVDDQGTVIAQARVKLIKIEHH